MQSLSGTIAGVIAIDGKTLRRSHDEAKGKKALHMGSRLGGGKSSGACTNGRGGKIERDYSHPQVVTTTRARLRVL